MSLNGTAVAIAPLLTAPDNGFQRAIELEKRKRYVKDVLGGPEVTNLGNRVTGNCAAFIESMLKKIDSRYNNAQVFIYEKLWLTASIYDYFGMDVNDALRLDGTQRADTKENTIRLGEKYFMAETGEDDLVTLIHEVFHLQGVSAKYDHNMSHCELLKLYYPRYECNYFTALADSLEWKNVMRLNCGAH